MADAPQTHRSLRFKYLLTGHGLIVPRDHGTVGDHFDDARGRFVPEDCTVVVEREPPGLEELRAAGSLRFASIQSRENDYAVKGRGASYLGACAPVVAVTDSQQADQTSQGTDSCFRSLTNTGQQGKLRKQVLLNLPTILIPP